MARGLALYDVDLGAAREETAAANAINEKTVQDWNQYLWLSQQEANRRAHLRRVRQMRRDAQSGDAVSNRIRNQPTPDDIESGAALNVVLDQLTDPRIQSSALRLGTTPIDSKVIKNIPFQSASAAIALSLDQMTAQGELPLALQGEKFGPERLEYQQAIDQALQESEQGDISQATLQRVDKAVAQLHAKLRANPSDDRAAQSDAENYVRTLYGMTRLLRSPQIDKVLGELDKVPQTTLGNLLGFMHAYNLRFGDATTPAQREIYQNLYPPMVALRDRVVKEAGTDQASTTARDSRGRPIDFFQGMSLEHLSRRPSDNPPAKQ